MLASVLSLNKSSLSAQTSIDSRHFYTVTSIKNYHYAAFAILRFTVM